MLLLLARSNWVALKAVWVSACFAMMEKEEGRGKDM